MKKFYILTIILVSTFSIINAQTPSWNCCNGEACVDPGDGSGTYSTLATCLSACGISASWDCDGQGNCIDPGNGTGTYQTLAICQQVCVTPSWNCIGSGICISPQDGSGQFSSETACINYCTNPPASWASSAQSKPAGSRLCCRPGRRFTTHQSLARPEAMGRRTGSPVPWQRAILAALRAFTHQ